MPDWLHDLLAGGKLSQVCPSCGTREAAGYHCTKCLTPTGPSDWPMNLTTAKVVLTRLAAGEPVDRPYLEAAADALLGDTGELPIDVRLRAHPANIATWDDLAFHGRWHLDRNELAGHDHPPEAFRRYRSAETFVIVGADPEAGTITLAHADDHTLTLKHERAGEAAAALASGVIPDGVVGEDG